MAQYISKGINKIKTNTTIIGKLEAGLKNKKDKIKFREIVEELKFGQKPPKYSAFLNQIRIENDEGTVLISIEPNSKKEHSVLVNGQIVVSYDPNNVWSSISTSKIKTSLFNILFPFAYADEKGTDAISAAILMTAAGDGVNKEVIDNYFEDNKVESEISLRASCVGSDKAKSYNKKWNFNIEDNGDYYKISSPSTKAYFQIKTVTDSLTAAELAQCYRIANTNLQKKPIEKVVDSILVLNLPSLTKKEQDSLKDSPQDRYLMGAVKTDLQIVQRKCENLKISVLRCDGERCEPSEWWDFAEMFDPSSGQWKDKSKTNRRVISDLIGEKDELTRIAEDSKQSQVKVSDARIRLKKIDEKIEAVKQELISSVKPFVTSIKTEMLNLNAFGKCCANNPCRQQMYKVKKIDMKAGNGVR